MLEPDTEDVKLEGALDMSDIRNCIHVPKQAKEVLSPS